MLNGKTNPNQGENVDFDLKITPENTATDYYVIFKSYDPEDTSLQKTFIALNGQKITFGKEYKIEDFNKVQVRINSFNAGNKQLKYVIKNSTSQREEYIQQNVLKNVINININFDKEETNNIQEILNIKGYITKSPSYNKKIWYKTWLSEGEKNGIENTDNQYKEYTLSDSNEFNINIKSQKAGKYTYFIQFKDEFENTSNTIEKQITINDKTFSIEQITSDLSDIYQGDAVSLIFNINGSYEKGKYKIKFISFDEKDINLYNSSIKINEKDIKINELREINGKNKNNYISISSFNYGQKKLVYEIFEESNEEIKVRKETIIDFKKAPISVSFEIDKYIYENHTFTIKGKVNHRSKTKKIQYRSVAFYENDETLTTLSNDIFTTTNYNWENITLTENNEFSLSLKSSQEQYYIYHIEFKDEYGNEWREQIPISVRSPLIVKEAYGIVLSPYSIWNNNQYQNYIKLKLNIATFDQNEKLLKVFVRFPKESETYIYKDKNGNNHTLKIRTASSADWNDWELGNGNSYNEEHTVQRVNLKSVFSLGTTPSIKTDLLQIAQKKYKAKIEIVTTKSSYHREINLIEFQKMNY
ncbi:MAG: hypothetical protein Q3983_02150 [Capnocytophaga sp.]|nr:hypothetical protein [Capnocytophaga sp.]